MSTVERKFVLTRIRAGDYLLPSNDEQTLWRICSYTEDGSLQVANPDGSWRTITGRFWRTMKFNRPPGDFFLLDPDDVIDWENWDYYDERFETRAEAIDAALMAEPPL